MIIVSLSFLGGSIAVGALLVALNQYLVANA